MCPAFRKQVEARKLFWYLLLQDNLQDVKTKQKTIPLPKKAPLKQKQSKKHERLPSAQNGPYDQMASFDAAPVMWSQLHPWFGRKPCFSGLTESVLCIPRGRGYYSGVSTQSSETQEGVTGLGRGCWFKGSHFSLLDCQPWKMRFQEWLSYLRGETDWEGSPASKENWEMLPSDINWMLDQTVPEASVSMNLSKHMCQGGGGDTLLFKTF